MKGLYSHVYLEEAPGQTRVAFISSKTNGLLNADDISPDSICEIWHRRWDAPSLINTVHFARIEQLFAAQNRASARLHDGTAISLRLRAKEQPKPGAISAVTITAAPRQGKSWQAVLGARLVSRYGILLPDSHGIFRSNRISTSDNIDAMEAMIKATLPHDYGFIIRSAASTLSVEAMEDDVKALLRTWQAGLHISNDQMGAANVPCLIHDAGGLAGQIARHAPDAEVMEVREPSTRQHLTATMDEVIDNAMQARVALQQGGRLWCQRTHALWAIDIDSADYNNPKSSDMIQSLATVAIPEIIRQIRLRAMGGAVLVDLPRLGSRSGKTVLKQFSDACALDPLAPEILGFTRGGLLELRVPYGEQSLIDIMADRVAQAALTGLRMASLHIASSTTPAEIKLAVSAPVAKWLLNEGASACAKLDRPLHPVVLSDLAPDAPAYIMN